MIEIAGALESVKMVDNALSAIEKIVSKLRADPDLAALKLADALDDDNDGDIDLNPASDLEEEVMGSRADDTPDYNIEQITDNDVEDVHPLIDSTGVYWLKENGNLYDLWYEDAAGNEKEIATNLNNDGWGYTADNGKHEGARRPR